MSLPGQPTTYEYDHPHVGILVRFKSPFSDPKANRAKALGTVLIVAPEFTSLCPLTGQPDFAKIVVEYTPDKWCVESKAFKLYLGAFRQHKDFHEACVVKICNDLVKVLSPFALKVEGQFTPRGGIPFWPTASYTK